MNCADLSLCDKEKAMRPRICELFDTSTPREYTLLNNTIFDTWIKDKASFKPIPVPRGIRCPNCYLCGKRTNVVHWFYHQLCTTCGDASYEKRNLKKDLSGQRAIVTGGRIKLGYQIVLKLLRAGAEVMITSRYWKNALIRYQDEPDFEVWKERLHVCRLNFDLLNLDQLLPEMDAELSRIWPDDSAIDIVIHNAAQTICNVKEGSLKRKREDHDDAARPRKYPPRQWFTNVFPEMDRYERQLEERKVNTWSTVFSNVNPTEAKQVLIANAWAPFVLNQFLLPRLAASQNRQYIIHVHAKEGHFNSHKTLCHMHTNMAKAALSMMTRCLALPMSTYSGRQQYQKKWTEELPWTKRYLKMPFLDSSIQHRGRNHHDITHNLNVHGVDPGWFSVDEYTLQTRKEKNLFFSPIDEIDAASRVVYPIFTEAPSYPGTWRHYIPLINF